MVARFVATAVFVTSASPSAVRRLFPLTQFASIPLGVQAQTTQVTAIRAAATGETARIARQTFRPTAVVLADAAARQRLQTITKIITIVNTA